MKAARRLPDPHSGRRQGFTLMEILTVLAVLAIALMIGAPLGISALRQSQLRDGATQVVTELQRLRSQAQRDSAELKFSLSTSNPNSYTLTKNSVAEVRTLPHNLQLSADSGGSSAIFSAPYAELNPNVSPRVGLVWVVSAPGSSKKLYVKLVGVTGKVVLSATN
ncbi:pilus assembly FimT family protein [Deinococcus koreensis]|nr:prepilin-type N-terminal cleavage/methylation domain-containing protein [Deinococcus koreensis]